MNDEVRAAKMLRKITPSTVTTEVGINLMQLQRPVQPQALYDLFGVVARTKQGQTDKGPWLAFLGEFEAVTPDGEIFQSGKTHIPVLEDLLYASLMQAQEKDPKATLQIAIRVGIKTAPANKPSATGYEFEVQNLIPAATNNTIMALKQLAAKTSATLPAPKAETKVVKDTKK